MSELRLKLPPGVTEEEARLLLAIKLYEEGRISLGKAAEVAGYTRPTFMEILSRRKVPLLDYLAEELESELK